MKTKTLYHGTTLKNWLKIKESGFDNSENIDNWYCSESFTTYFYNLDSDELEDEEDEYRESRAIQMGFESAQLAAAIQNYLGETLVVIKVEIEDNEDNLSLDYSCENMESTAVSVDNDYLNSYGTITSVFIDEKGYTPSMRLLVVYGLINSGNQHINTGEFTEKEHEVIKALSGSDIYLEMDFDYTTEVIKSLVAA